MNQYLHNLAKEILHNESNGLSKVRFVKTIYFVHKGLVKKELIQSDAMRFIRMPLGPVPVGFKELHADSGIIVKITTSSLSYNTETYLLKTYKEYFDRLHKEAISSLVDKLKNISTSELVEISHQEPSWFSNGNGSEFYISERDLKQDLPTKNAINTINPEIDEQRIQGYLVEGMLNDIVEESTLLEYPDK
jgi:uncharacterized phage-associated protein